MDPPANSNPTGETVDDKLGRIFVNRNLKLTKIGLIGFDLDHTLAEYISPAMERLAFDKTKVKLVEKWGYPSWVADIRYAQEYVIRGLVLDKRRGNIIKMDYYNFVSRVYHGRRRLSEVETKRSYRSDRVRLSSDAYVSVDTLFELPEIYLFMSLVEGLDAREKNHTDFTKVYRHVREAIDEAHRDGSIKREIVARPELYIRRDPKLGQTLWNLRRGGKKLFVLTNSDQEYTNEVMRFLLEIGPKGRGTWKDYFNLIVVNAGKPDFFHREKGESEEVDGGLIHGGNPFVLEEMTGYGGDQVLYFGDHTYGDILKSKKSLGWRTAFIASELDEEIKVTARIEEDIHRAASLSRDIREHQLQLDGWMEELRELRDGNGDLESPGIQAKIAEVQSHREALEKKVAGLKRHYQVISDRCDRAFNKHWGSLFREGSEPSRFGHQIRDFACIYTSRVSNFLNYSPHHYFRSTGNLMPHEL